MPVMRLCAGVLFAGLLMSAPALAAGLTTGSQYNNGNLPNSDGSVAIVWEGNRLLGAGTLDSFTFEARNTNTLRPFIVRQSGSNYVVTAIGSAFTPTVGMNTATFTASSGTNAFNTAGGDKYYFGFAAASGSASPVAYNDNGEHLEGMPFGYTGSFTFNGTSVGGSFTPVMNYNENARHYAVNVKTTLTGVHENVGFDLVNRVSLDGEGYTVVRTDSGFTQAGRVSTWSGFADINFFTGARTITPLILRNNGTAQSPDYEIIGVGTKRTFGARDYFYENFGLVSGTDVVAPGDLIGWADTEGDGGIVPYNTTYLASQNFPNGTISYFNTGIGDLVAGQSLGVGVSDGRNYSIAFQTTAVPEPAALSLLGLGTFALLRRRRSTRI